MRCILLTCAACLLAAADVVTLRADLYPPHNADPKSDKPGVMVEIARKVFAQVDYQVMPWTRTIEEVQAGRIDGAIGAEPSGTPDLVMPSEAQGHWQPVFMTPAGSTWSYAGIDSLKGLAIGVVADYDYGTDPEGASYNAWFQANPQKVQTIKGDKPIELAMGMLAKKRLDLFVEDEAVARASAASAKVDFAAIRVAGKAGAGYPLFIGFSPTERGRALARQLAEGTVRLRASGELAAILTRYGMADWKQ